MPNTNLICSGCCSEFAKRTAEIKRQLKKNPNRKFYCSLACYGQNTAKHHLGDHLSKGDASRLIADNRRDEFSPFRYFLNKARERKRHGPTDLDLPYLKSLWGAQKGRCALSGMGIHLPPTTAAFERDKGNPWKASLDRIDNDKGYLKGNVRFVTSIANMARNHWSDDIVVQFCRRVAEHHKEIR